MLIIDSHAHLWTRARTPQPWIDPVSMSPIDRDFVASDLASLQAKHGISGSVLVQSSNSESETLDLLAVSDSPAVLGVVGWLDLEGDVSAALARYGNAPGGGALVGIRHLAHQDPDPRWLARASVGHGLDALASAGLPFDFVVQPSQLVIAAETAAAHPETTFVLDHLGKPPIASGELDQWMRDLALFEPLTNVVAKVSGIVVEASWDDWTVDDLRPVFDQAVTVFGADRLMFGTDWPLIELAGGGRWVDAFHELLSPMSSQEREHMLSTTATTVYGLTNA